MLVSMASQISLIFLLSIVELVSNIWMLVPCVSLKASYYKHNANYLYAYILTSKKIYAYILCNSYRVKENKTMLARLLNFSKQLIAKIISGSNGFTELKIQWVLSMSWYLSSHIEEYVIVTVASDWFSGRQRWRWFSWQEAFILFISNEW